MKFKMNKKAGVNWILIFMIIFIVIAICGLIAVPVIYNINYNKDCLKNYADIYCSKKGYFSSRLNTFNKMFNCFESSHEDLQRKGMQTEYFNFLKKELEDCKK